MSHRQDPDIETKRAEFEAITVPMMKALYGAARRLTPVAEDAEDLVQETYARAYRAFDNFTPGTNCKAWLFTIMYSVFVNQYRKARRRGPTVSLDDLEQRFQHYIEAPSDSADSVTTVAAWGVRLAPEVKEAMERLSADFRAPVLLVDVEGLSYDEAAGVLGCPVGTVRSRLFRARRALFAMLHDYAAQSGLLRGRT